MSKYDDDLGFNLARVFGPENHRRIMVPRRMAPLITVDNRVDGLNVSFQSAFVPRHAEQQRVIDESVQLLANGENFMTEAPTGFGKTYVGAEIIARMQKKAIVVITKEDIFDQWLEAFKNVLGLTMGKGVGLIKGDKCLTDNCKVVLAYIQSISKENRYPDHVFKSFGLAMWDECHRVGADHFNQSCYRIPAKLRIGISATADRKDGREELMEAHIGPVMVRSTQAPMPFKVLARRSPWRCPMKPMHAENGKVVMRVIPHSPGKCGHILRMLAGHFGRNKLIIDFIIEAYKAGRTILVQSDTLEHLDTLYVLTTASVRSHEMAFYVGGMTSAERDIAKTKRVIFATYKMTAEATDIPPLDTLVMASPKSDVRQIVGRIRRFLPGKKMPTVFDIIDATSPVFSGYWNKRKEWYSEENVSVEIIGSEGT